MTWTHWNTLPPPSDECTPCTVTQRLIAGFGFRFYWATDGLRQEDWDFKASEDSMSIYEVSEHIYGLAGFTSTMLNCRVENQPHESADDLRKNILDSISHSYSALGEMDTTSLSHHDKFWFAFNGPIADAFTHIGQICSWRRINGNPLSGVNYLNGKKTD